MLGSWMLFQKPASWLCQHKLLPVSSSVPVIASTTATIEFRNMKTPNMGSSYTQTWFSSSEKKQEEFLASSQYTECGF